MNFISIFGFFIFLGYGIAQIYAGFIGVDYHLGGFWALIVLILAFGFRFILPVTIASFFGAYSVWGWHWAVSLIFAMPGLIFMFPTVVSIVKESVKR